MSSPYLIQSITSHHYSLISPSSILNATLVRPLLTNIQECRNLSRVDHERKIRSRRQWMDIGKYSFENRAIRHWNQLPADVLETLPCKQITFKKWVKKAIIEVS
jgi:hypothetical protein